MKIRSKINKKPVIEPSDERFSKQIALASGLLSTRPQEARHLAEDILKTVPAHPHALLILGSALRVLGLDTQAVKVLGDLLRDNPSLASGQYEFGLALRRRADPRSVAAFRAAAMLKPDMVEAWDALGDRKSMQAAQAIQQGRLTDAVDMLSARLEAQPTDLATLRLLAEGYSRLARLPEAEMTLSRCLDLSPNLPGARQALVVILINRQKAAAALIHIDRLLRAEPANLHFLQLKAVALGYIGEETRAISIYEEILKARPASYGAWLSYGHALKTAGRLTDSVTAYRRVIAINPGLSRAYWGLANLKTVKFSDEDIGAMEAALAADATLDDDRFHFHYALGKAFEDRQAFEAAFGHYQEGARLRRKLTPYDAEATTVRFAQARAFFSPALFNRRPGMGCNAADPIFVVGLPRSGSTLVEQILSSHSQIEGTQELVELSAIVKDFKRREAQNEALRYPEVLDALEPEAIEALGARYIEATRQQRKTDRPLFIDKTPSNFEHIGLIQMILPNAKIIDVRRAPMASCFSAFKQHFASGHDFSYDLEDLGQYYNDYLKQMDHFEVVLPGRVCRVIYEQLVEDSETEIRRLLDYCGLAFEPACLRFYENDRAVRTPSAEQVRRPVFRDSLEQWRNFEPWLQPLKDTLGRHPK